MTFEIIKYLTILILLVLFEFAYLYFAKVNNIKDNPNHRSAHTIPTLRGGGIIFPVGIISYIVFFSEEIMNYIWLGLSVLIIALISFVDDIKSLSSKLRITVHLLAFCLLFYSLGYFNAESTHLVIYFIILLFFSLGYLNIYNFMDGINGIMALNGLVTFSTFLFINEMIVSFEDRGLLVVMVMSTLIFSFFNFRKKPLCFSGDVGSIVLGFMNLYFIQKLYLVTDNPIVLLMFLVYLLDGGWTIIERLFRKENIFEAHRRHLYQILANDLKIGHLKISTGYFIIQLVLNIIVVYYINTNKVSFIYSLSIIILFSFFYFYIKRRIYLKIKKLS